MYMRDRAGLTFVQKGRQIREVSRSYAEHYDHMMQEEGLHQRLVADGKLVKHSERGLKYAHTEDAYRVLLPQSIPLETYPYEWSFSQYKAVTRHVLDIAQTALEYDMILRDVDINSVQLSQGQPIWTDMLAFDLYREGKPWAAYTQFVQQYLAPLALMSKVDITLGKLPQIYPTGVPISLASSMLPARTRLNFGLLNHIHNHSRTKERNSHATRKDMFDLLNDLWQVITDLTWTVANPTQETGEVDTGSFDPRQRLLRDALGETQAKTVWDLNAAEGLYSRIASSEFGASVVAFNKSPHDTEQLWLQLDERERSAILPLMIDWANPSPGLGWLNHERRSIRGRANADLLIGMGLVHKLALQDGITFSAMAAKFARMAPTIVIEFVPGSDPQMIAMMERGQEVMPDYTRENFEAAFSEHYNTIRAEEIARTARQVYYMQRHSG